MMLKIVLLILASSIFAKIKCSEYRDYEEKMIKDTYYDETHEDGYKSEAPEKHDMREMYKAAEKEYNERSYESGENKGQEAPKCPVGYQSYVHEDGYSKTTQKVSEISAKVCNKLLELDNVPPDQVKTYLSKYTIPNEYCPFAVPIKCNKDAIYRTIDGSCNNPLNPFMGKSEMPFKRMMPPRYTDHVNEPVKYSYSGKPLPNCRHIALSYLTVRDTHAYYNMLGTHFGQFLGHDLSGTPLGSGPDGKTKRCTCKSKSADCLIMKTPRGDPYWTEQECSAITRSASTYATMQCKLGLREQMNSLTAYVDASPLYGSLKRITLKLRAFKKGLMTSSYVEGLKGEQLPLAPKGSGLCFSEKKGVPCVNAAENRANTQVGLVAVHTLYLRMHNKIARELANLNKYWDDEKVFHEARKIVIGIHQHIVYNEYLPLVIGKKFWKLYGLDTKSDGYEYGYDPYVKAAIYNEHATVAGRYGHSVVSSYVLKADRDLYVIKNVSLSKSLLQTEELYTEQGIESILAGAVIQSSYATDRHFSEIMNHRLFESKDPKAEIKQHSITCLNINRANDHGLKGYADYVNYLGLPKIKIFDDLDLMSRSNANKLRELYENVYDIPLYVGGISEIPVKGGIVGVTFAHFIGKQYRDLKYGDNHFYSFGHNDRIKFKPEQLREIKKISMARVLCDNIDIEHVPLNAMLVEGYENNPIVSCDTLPIVNLKYWQDEDYNRGSQSDEHYKDENYKK